LRFDDRLETALTDTGGSDPEQLGQWRQLIDLLAQDPMRYSETRIAHALTTAHRLANRIPDVDRLAGVMALFGRIKSPPLIQLLCRDNPRVAQAAIAGARLSDRQWADLIPQLPTLARGLLRNREDMGPHAKRVLQQWSGADFVLPNPYLTDFASDELIEIPTLPSISHGIANKEISKFIPQQQDIADIVERIETLRRSREADEAPFLPYNNEEFHEQSVLLDEFGFEADELGVISWTDGTTPKLIVGTSIAEPGFGDGPGPDAFGAAAFRQRMPIENARLRLCGPDAIDGEWRITAAPFFDSRSGRFRGYRGILRRPNQAETAVFENGSNTKVEADQIQQLLHELRTPLSAIIGFSEIIDQQLFGPASSEYRALAKSIHHDATRLLGGFDDLAITARLENGKLENGAGHTKCHWLLDRIAMRLLSLSETLHINLNLSVVDPVRSIAIDSALTERMFSRLLSSIMIACNPGETLSGRIRTEIGRVTTNRFVLTLPERLQNFDEVALFSSGIAATSDNLEASLLGLGFSLRLVRNLAQNSGGDLRFYNDCLILSLPAARDEQLLSRNEDAD
jgi:signal transduction histidine kinase